MYYSRTLTRSFLTLLLLCGLTPSISFAEDPPATDPPAASENLQKEDFKSVEERRLYTVLQNERDSLEEDKKVLVLKEKELKTLQVEADKKLELLDKKLAELQKIQKQIENLLAKKDAAELQKTKNLSLIYAKMSPDRAALAIATLDEQLAANLLANMKVKSAAKILDRMDKVKASQLSTTFTTIKLE
jgi:flagellar motility protein MotE (MotC chaperone)